MDLFDGQVLGLFDVSKHNGHRQQVYCTHRGAYIRLVLVTLFNLLKLPLFELF